MLRSIVLAICLCACKVVHSTAFDDGGTSDGPGIGFLSESTTVHESIGTVIVVVSLSRPAEDTITVTYQPVDGTATQFADYDVLGSELTFLPGEASKGISVTIFSDGFDEVDEDFAIDLVNIRGARLDTSGFDRSRHTVSIMQNQVPRVSFEDPSSFATERTHMQIGVLLSEQTSNVVSVDIGLSGTAVPNVDYVVPPLTVTFPPGSIREQISVDKLDDDFDEADETIVYTVTNVANGVVGPIPVHTHTIRDDDVAPQVRFAQVAQTVSEGNAGDTLVTVAVVLTGPTFQTIDVPFSVDAASTAVSPADYHVVTASPISFAPGNTVATITIAISGEPIVEGREDVKLQLGMPSYGTLSVPQLHTIAIANDDCLGTGAFEVCPDVSLAGAIVLPGDLSTDSACTYVATVAWSERPVCVMFARSISVGSTFAHGSRPLVLAATDTIMIGNLLDASGHRGYGGPASSSASCQSFAGPPGPNAGGAGGSFMTAGGDGGAHTNSSGTGGGAAAADAAAPTQLRGGCNGQVGGDNFSSYSFGYGGGAVYLLAGGSITFQPNAIINASGDGAYNGVDLSNGGSGGGSGGMIVLFAPIIQAMNAFIVANGGGGAEGGDNNQYGTPGGIPNPATPFVSAPGGIGTPGGDGGRGFAEGSLATSGVAASNARGAGGGGGGAGYIRSNQSLTGASASPTPQ